MEQVIKQVNVSDLRDSLALALRKVEHGGLCYVVRRHGRPVAALVSMEVIEEYWEAQNTYDPEQAMPPAPVPEPEPELHGYLRRLFRRKRARAAARQAKGEAESRHDQWCYEQFRGMDDGV